MSARHEWLELTTQPNSRTHPFKVEGRAWSGGRLVLIGRAMFRDKSAAEAYAKGTGDGGEDFPVLRSKHGDIEFA